MNDRGRPEQLLRIGSRTSTLAMQQTQYIAGRLEALWPALRCEIVPFVTHGDRTLDHPLPAIGGKGLFTAELEAALNAGEIDIAVHSLKDLPVADSPGLALGAIPNREDVRDVLVVQGGAVHAGAVGDANLTVLTDGAAVGTSSLRRQAQLLAVRPDLQVRSIRGNVETRIRKVTEGQYDATVLAAAGLVRVGLIGQAACYLPLELMLPAPGQGALAVQCREDDDRTLALLAAIEDADVRAAVTAERAFLHALDAGCSAPVAAFATPAGNGSGALEMRALVASHDGRQVVRVAGQGADPQGLGETLAAQALRQGAEEILARV